VPPDAADPDGPPLSPADLVAQLESEGSEVPPALEELVGLDDMLTKVWMAYQTVAELRRAVEIRRLGGAAETQTRDLLDALADRRIPSDRRPTFGEVREAAELADVGAAELEQLAEAWIARLATAHPAVARELEPTVSLWRIALTDLRPASEERPARLH
jgi:hypothetical protein